MQFQVPRFLFYATMINNAWFWWRPKGSKIWCIGFHKLYWTWCCFPGSLFDNPQKNGAQIYFTNSDGNLGYHQNHLIGVPLDLLTSKNMDTLNREDLPVCGNHHCKVGSVTAVIDTMWHSMWCLSWFVTLCKPQISKN